MDPIVALLIGLVVGVALGAVIGLLVARTRSTNPATAHVLGELKAEAAAADATATALRGQVDQLLEAQRTHQVRQESDSRVLQALSPVQEVLRTMQQKVTDLETQRSVQHGQLSEQLKNAAESEERLRSTAESLASALRNNSTRGVWGETQLRNVVQAAGLIERVDFDVQHSIRSDDGAGVRAGRPDMVIHLPGGKNIAVDAKVPFSSFLEASQIAATATGEEGARRELLLKQHVRVIRNHIDSLASKAYWAGLDASPELVIAFIPSESLVSSAMEADPSIMDYAFSKRVALASPVTLWSVLKTVAFSWQQDVLTDQAKSLFDLGKELYQRIATLSEHADKLRRSIDSTVTSYNQFANSLESRVLVSARKLNALDESKVIPPSVTIDAAAKPLTAVEFDREAEAS